MKHEFVIDDCQIISAGGDGAELRFPWKGALAARHDGDQISFRIPTDRELAVALGKELYGRVTVTITVESHDEYRERRRAEKKAVEERDACVDPVAGDQAKGT